MADCSCPRTGWPDPDCPTHGLRPGVAFPPMDRHKLPGEDARDAQRRLYLESLGQRECGQCGRIGKQGFVEDIPEIAHGMKARRWICRGQAACRQRSRRRGADATRRVSLVANEIRTFRFVYADEADLQDAVARALAPRWVVSRERRLGSHERLDLWVQDLRVAVETKVAGDVERVFVQVKRYLAHPEVDGLVLVTNRVRHRLPAEIKGKPVAVVQLAVRAF